MASRIASLGRPTAVAAAIVARRSSVSCAASCRRASPAATKPIASPVHSINSANICCRNSSSNGCPLSVKIGWVAPSIVAGDGRPPDRPPLRSLQRRDRTLRCHCEAATLFYSLWCCCWWKRCLPIFFAGPVDESRRPRRRIAYKPRLEVQVRDQQRIRLPKICLSAPFRIFRNAA